MCPLMRVVPVPVPGPASFDFDLEGEAQERADEDDEGEHAEGLERGRHRHGADDVGRHQELEAEQDAAAEVGAVGVVGLGPWRPGGQRAQEGGGGEGDAEHDGGDAGDLERAAAERLSTLLDGTLRPVPPELRPQIGDLFTVEDQRNRCPGAAEHVAPDNSNPWKPTPDFNCDPTQTLPNRDG